MARYYAEPPRRGLQLADLDRRRSPAMRLVTGRAFSDSPWRLGPASGSTSSLGHGQPPDVSARPAGIRRRRVRRRQTLVTIPSSQPRTALATMIQTSEAWPLPITPDEFDLACIGDHERDQDDESAKFGQTRGFLL
jgi:hypothetical protein